MKRILSLLPVLVLLLSVTACAQNQTKPSPPASAELKAGDATIKINYSAPSVKGREIWGKLVPYGEVWRTGANEATEITLTQKIKIGGKTLAPPILLYNKPEEAKPTSRTISASRRMRFWR